jgi:hypothetical protein
MSELIKALVAARKEIGAAVKDKMNPHFKSKYADLGAVIDAVKGPLEKHDLTFVQDIEADRVLTVLYHANGESLRLAPFPIIAAKPDAQGHGSALTYARRYSLMTALGVPAEDDDGNAATKPAADKPAFVSPVTSALEGETFSKEQVASLNKLANSLVDLCTLAAEGEDVDYKIWELMEPLEQGEKLYLWQLLQPQSKVRTRVKAVVTDRAKKDAMARNAQPA